MYVDIRTLSRHGYVLNENLENIKVSFKEDNRIDDLITASGNVNQYEITLAEYKDSGRTRSKHKKLLNPYFVLGSFFVS